jgi:hypothetical protein
METTSTRLRKLIEKLRMKIGLVSFKMEILRKKIA